MDRVQHETLLSHCRFASNTAFGRAHALGTVRSHADFCKRVPLRSYVDFEPYVARLQRGERDVLWPGVIPYLARSAGSSSQSPKQLKMLPISHQQIGWQRKQAFDVLARYLVMAGDRRFTAGYTLGLLQPPTIARRGAVGLTSNPRLMQLHVPKVARMLSLPRGAVRDIEANEEKFRALAEAYLDYDVRAIAGTTCWFTVFFDRVLAAARARGRSVSTVHEVWPNLRGLFGGGVHAGSYRSIIDARVGGKTVLVDTYNATEGGCFAITDRNGDESMLMLPDRGVFFEFIPRSELDRSAPTRLSLTMVEPHVEYAVAVSTASGLFGYLMGDVVRFSSVFPHRLTFSGRVSGEISIAHEMTTARQIEDAVHAAAAQNDCTLVEFAASAELASEGSAVGRYMVFAEFERPPDDVASLARDIDRGLCESNRLYRKHRAGDVGILPLTVIPLARGAAQRFADAAGRSGLQQKFPHIVGNAERELLRALRRACAQGLD